MKGNRYHSVMDHDGNADNRLVDTDATLPKFRGVMGNYHPIILYVVFCLPLFMLLSCGTKDDDNTLFKLMPSSRTKIDFANTLKYTNEFNIYTYRNFYNGGGVALGDINNDGLIDIYFTSNQESNKLYLNKGNFQFEDITDKAGAGGTRAWSTGVSMADVNGDGWLDIYVCNSGDIKGDNKQNELFINNGDLTFSEKSEKYHVDDKGFTTHAAFFDYDRDGDLDLYVLNNSYQANGNFNLMKDERSKRDSLGGDKLLRNDIDHFVDVSEEAGIYGSIIGFGLGVTVGDVNKDGWLDIYVSNDFFERDYLYLNQGNGTFRECLTELITSISGSSMGADLADINNDTWPDIFVTDMLPASNERLKSVTTFQNWDNYKYNLINNYYHQFNRNCFQLNNGDSTFFEIGRLLGVQATDWSWGALMFDMNNDGLKDIFVANGIFKDLTNQDYLQNISSEEVVKSLFNNGNIVYSELIDAIPSHRIANVAFENKGDLNFANRSAAWGLAQPSFSNGSAYGDLDNDGDLDLVVNNVNMTAFVYQNQSEKIHPDNHYLKIVLKGGKLNTSAIGAKITAEGQRKKFYAEQIPMRGFESNVDPRPNIGVGAIDTLDRVVINWPYGEVTVLDHVPVNQTLYVNEPGPDEMSAKNKMPAPAIPETKAKALLHEVSASSGINFHHIENDFVDFDRDHLLFHMLSTEGPRLCTGDVNGDGLDDFYVGGASGYPGVLYQQGRDGKFTSTNEELFREDKICEDRNATFFDADGDGDLDLYVASGGNEFSEGSDALRDRLYINDGKGDFSRKALDPAGGKTESTSCVKAADFDGDGDQDLFIGTRLQPLYYGLPVNGYILQNDGAGNFRNVTDEVAPSLLKIGLITDAVWQDVDNDNDPDLVVVGEWMPVTVLINEKGKFINSTSAAGLDHSNGWWNCIAAADVDHDGDVDFVVGNHGLNSRFKASVDKPVTIYTSDFDQNGDIEQIICMYNGDKSYPMVLRNDIVMQLQGLKKKYLRYDDYKDATIEDVFSPAELEKAVKLSAYELRTVLMINDGKGRFTRKELPVEVQFSTVYAVMVEDLDGDGNEDIFLGGNLYGAKPEVGRYDASRGFILKGNGRGDFVPVPAAASGVKIKGEVRDIKSLTDPSGKKVYLVSRNNDTMLVYKR